MTFSGKIYFPSKVPEFLHVSFNLVEKHSPVSFLGLNALVFPASRGSFPAVC